MGLNLDCLMSRITYFPRYSGPENVVTNTTLHLLSQINQQSTVRLRTLLSDLLDADELPLGIGFQQQTVARTTVPDGSIVQEPLHIVIETKVGAGINIEQLLGHYEAFKPGRTSNYLILLTKHGATDGQLKPVLDKSKETGVIFKHVTFEQLYNRLQDFALPHETHLKYVVDDFREYCADMDLLPDRRKWLRIVPCGNTIHLNAKWDAYYQPAERGYSSHQYLGIYYWKAVRYVGKIAAVYDNDEDGNGGMSLKLVEGAGNPEFERRIRGMVKDSKSEIGWDVSSDKRFFCVEKFAPTEFWKDSSGGIQGARFWDITELVKEDTTDAELAEELRRVKWE